MVQYKIAYRFSNKEKFIWKDFNFLWDIKYKFYTIFKRSSFFKIFIQKNNKYITLTNKPTFLKNMRVKVAENMVKSGYKKMLHNNIREFKETVENSFKRIQYDS